MEFDQTFREHPQGVHASPRCLTLVFLSNLRGLLIFQSQNSKIPNRYSVIATSTLFNLNTRQVNLFHPPPTTPLKPPP